MVLNQFKFGQEPSSTLRVILLFIIVVAQLAPIRLHGQKKVIKKHLIPKDKIGRNKSNLKINGYYYTKHIDIKVPRDTIKYIAPLVLFENGSAFIYDYVGNGKGIYKRSFGDTTCFLNEEGKKNFSNITAYFTCLLPSLEFKDVYTVYAIYDRIIKIQRKHKKYLREETGIIINDSTFVINKVIDYTNKKMNDVEQIYFFKKAIKPDSSKLKLNKFYK